MTETSRIRNFCIVAHIDHGKSTLADRILELTHAVAEREMRDQYLDKMDLERERGITIKAQAVRLTHQLDGTPYVLNLIDTPGHVDFTYEVSRSLAACEGAVLLVDAAQGIEAQTLANFHLARDAGLAIIPALNKIDLPQADPEETAREVGELVGWDPQDVLRISAKTGQGVPELLRKVIELVPAPQGRREDPLRALVFDSTFDPYRGVVAYLRVKDGVLPSRSKIHFMAAKADSEAEECGVFAPEATPVPELGPGEVGYLVTGMKDVHLAKVGDTVTMAGKRRAREPLPGYREPKPMVWSGLYPAEGGDYTELRDALDKLKLNDAALQYEPEVSKALGFGFRCGFLGLLHMDIVKERLEREFGLELIATAPNVEFHVIRGDEVIVVHNPSEMPAARDVRPRGGAGGAGHDRHPVHVPGSRPGAVPIEARRAGRHQVPLAGAGRGPLPAPARRDHLRLLRPAEVEDPGLRVAGLRAGELPAGRSGPGGHPAARRAGGRVQRGRAPRQGGAVRPADGRAASRADPPAAVRRGDPGGDRLSHRRARNHQGEAQGRAGQVLWG